jgi:hypothetical protein
MRTRIAETLSQAYMVSAMPVLMVLGFLVFFYCLGALNDERRDRSLLFWKSLPVSDLTTVLSKLLLAVVIAPLITLGIGIVLSLVLVLAACFMLLSHGTNLFGALLSSPDFYLTPLRMIGLLPVYILWALPTVGWLLMVSSMVRSKVFLWAVGTPLVASLLLLWVAAQQLAVARLLGAGRALQARDQRRVFIDQELQRAFDLGHRLELVQAARCGCGSRRPSAGRAASARSARPPCPARATT